MYRSLKSIVFICVQIVVKAKYINFKMVYDSKAIVNLKKIE